MDMNYRNDDVRLFTLCKREITHLLLCSWQLVNYLQLFSLSFNIEKVLGISYDIYEH